MKHRRSDCRAADEGVIVDEGELLNGDELRIQFNAKTFKTCFADLNGYSAMLGATEENEALRGGPQAARGGESGASVFIVNEDQPRMT